MSIYSGGIEIVNRHEEDPVMRRIFEGYQLNRPCDAALVLSRKRCDAIMRTELSKIDWEAVRDQMEDGARMSEALQAEVKS